MPYATHVTTAGLFDRVAEDYDRWYDTVEGATVLEAELACLGKAVPRFCGNWLEIGVGTGRFAAALGIAEGIDPSPSMLAIAARRGIATRVGTGENLPYPSGMCSGVLMVAVLCFMKDVPHALGECSRVLRPDGTLLIGHIPADGPWGRDYIRKAAEGHPLYSQARFTTVDDVVGIAASAGFELQAAASGLFQPPGSPPRRPPEVRSGVVPGAGFVALALRRATAGSCAPVDPRV